MELKGKKIHFKETIAIVLPITFGIAIITFVIMLLFNVTDYGITLASFGASIFMILSDKTFKKKVFYGSYFVAIIIGYIFSTLTSIKYLNVALAVVSSFLIMTFFELQHPPAIGISAAMVLNKFSFLTDIFVLLCIFFIFTITWLLKLHLTNPTRVLSLLSIAEKDDEKIKWSFRPKETPEYLKLRLN